MKFHYTYVAWLLIICSPIISLAQNAPQLGKDPIPAIIKAMTLEEKVKLVVGKGFSFPGVSSAQDTTPNKKNQAVSGHTVAIPGLGIPTLDMADGPSGIHRFVMTKEDSANNLFSTAWPVGTLLASSWDTSSCKKSRCCVWQ